MSVEAKRGCGYRKVGGLYLVCDGPGRPCGRLPLPLTTCPCCGSGVKLTRAIQFINARALLENAPPCKTPKGCEGCPLNSIIDETVGLMTVGEKYYTPESFTLEAQSLGISKRVSAIPKPLELGKTWIFLGHKYAYFDGENKSPGIFHVFRPSRIELIVTKSMKDLDWVKNYEKRGVKLIEVPEDDRDHNPDVKDPASGETNLFE